MVTLALLFPRRLVVLLLAGAAVRLVLWSFLGHWELHIVDEQHYNLLARSLVERGEYGFEPGELSSLRPPLFPAMLAAVYQVFGLENWPAARLVQVAIGLAVVALVYRLGRLLYSSRAAEWGAAIACFYPPLVGHDLLLLTEPLFALLLCAACLALMLGARHDRLRWFALAGGLLGLGALTRSVLWFFPPVAAAMILCRRSIPARRRLAEAGLLLLCFAASIAPWAIRNTLLQRTFVTIDVMGGRNFMMGNYEFTPLYRAWDAINETGDRAWHSVLAGRYPDQYPGTTQGQRDKMAFREGVVFIANNPALTLKRDLVKLCNFWQLDRELLAGAATGLWGPTSRPVLVFLALAIWGSYIVTIVAAIFGALRAPPDDRWSHALVLIVTAFLCAAHAAVFAHSRYRLPLMPLLFPFAAQACLTNAWSPSRGRTWSWLLAIALCALLATSWIWQLAFIDLADYRSRAATPLRQEEPARAPGAARCLRRRHSLSWSVSRRASARDRGFLFPPIQTTTRD